jgi:parallel beta-helix repeat protein
MPAIRRFAAALAPPILLLAPVPHARADSAPTGYFVDCDAGDDSHAGTSPKEPWRTLRKVNSTVQAAGSDVWIKAGSTCRKQRLTVDWGGTGANRAIVGAYYVNDSGAHEGFEGSTRPTITGTYGAACRTATPSTCPVGLDGNDENAVPANQWDGLIQVRGSYVTVQDLAIADSSGSGVAHSAPRGKTESNVTFANLSITRTFNSGIRLERVTNDVLRDNSVDLVALMKVDGRAKNWPPGILVTDSAPAYVLIEGNKLSNSGGEGIGALRSTHLIVRGNVISNNRRPLIYLDNSSNTVVEHNMLLGNGYMNGVDESYGIGISIAVEPYKQGMRNSVQNVVRNNLLANTKGCFNFSVFRESKNNACPAGRCDDPASKGYKVGALIYGNTCLQDKGRYVSGSNLDVNDNVDKLEIVDNVFSAKSGTNCTLPALPPGKLKVDSNVFGTMPSDEACKGTNAKVGPTGIALDFARVNAGSVPSPDSFRPSGSAGARREGDAVDRKVIDGNEFPAAMREFSWSACRPSAEDWAKGLAYDFKCAARGNKPTIGGVE